MEKKYVCDMTKGNEMGLLLVFASANASGGVCIACKIGSAKNTANRLIKKPVPMVRYTALAFSAHAHRKYFPAVLQYGRFCYCGKICGGQCIGGGGLRGKFKFLQQSPHYLSAGYGLQPPGWQLQAG